MSYRALWHSPRIGICLSFTALCSLGVTSAIAEEEGAESIEEVVVTGSRLRRPDSDSPIPVTSLSSEELSLSGATAAGDLLNELPAISVGSSNTTNDGTVANPTVGTNLLNLRGLGVDRTLVIVDGRRHVGTTDGSTAVDVNSIPTALIERVEVSTGGASVSYGADAVSGVVNFILKDDFEGAQLDVQYGDTDEGGGEEISFAFTGGLNFDDDRGNVTLSVSHTDTKAVLSRERDFATKHTGFLDNSMGQIDPNNPALQVAVDNVRFPVFPAKTRLTDLVTGTDLLVRSDGTTGLFDLGTPVSASSSIGGDGFGGSEFGNVANGLERTSLEGRFHYDISDNTRFFTEAKYYGVETQVDGQPTFIPTAAEVVAPDNPFLQAIAQQVNDPMLFDGSFGAIRWGFNTNLGPRSTDVERDTYRLVTGFEGSFSIGNEEWNYETYYQYGKTDSTITNLNSINTRRFAFATDAVTDVGGVLGVPGAAVCRQTLAAGGVPTGDSDIDDCVALNIIGAASDVSQAARDFVRLNLVRDTEVKQQVFFAGISGDLMQLPAGPLSIATGIEYRKEESESSPDANWQSGISFDLDQQPLSGDYDVKEFYLEARAPLLDQEPFADILAVEVGGRVSDYNTVGKTTAWRWGVEWAPIEDVRFRVGKARAVRAPNIGELFRPEVTQFANLTDPCDADNLALGPDVARRTTNCAAILSALGIDPATYDDPLQAQSNTFTGGGNTELTEETADSLTIGMVIVPRFLPDLTITFDYFDIEIEEAVGSFGAGQIVNDCVDRFDSINNESCALVTRDATTGGVIDVQDLLFNIASLETSGIDFAFTYPFDFGDAGALSVRFYGTYLDTLTTTSNPVATPNKGAGEPGNPEWRANLQSIYQLDELTFSWTMRYIGKSVLDVQVQNGSALFDPFEIDATTIHDVQARYAFEQFDAFVGVNDLFDRAPPFGSVTSYYSPVGRSFYAGIRYRFE